MKGGLGRLVVSATLLATAAGASVVQAKERISAVKKTIDDWERWMQALLLKGRSYLQPGETSSASDLFLELMISYPKADITPAVCFFVGYYNMLEGNPAKAGGASELVVRDYPQSKARLCLGRIARTRGQRSRE